MKTGVHNLQIAALALIATSVLLIFVCCNLTSGNTTGQTVSPRFIHHQHKRVKRAAPIRRRSKESWVPPDFYCPDKNESAGICSDKTARCTELMSAAESGDLNRVRTLL